MTQQIHREKKKKKRKAQKYLDFAIFVKSFAVYFISLALSGKQMDLGVYFFFVYNPYIPLHTCEHSTHYGGKKPTMTIEHGD